MTSPRIEPMQLMGKAKKVTIFVAQAPGERGGHNYLRIMERLKAEGAAGATAFKSMASFGARAHVHTVRLADVASDLPIVIVWVDTVERVERILPLIWDMVSEGLITIEDTEVLLHTTTALPDLPKAARVGEIMTRDVVAVHPETPISELVADVVKRRFRAVPVVDAERRVVGMVTSGDLVRRSGLPIRLELLRTYGQEELQDELARLAASRRETRDVMTSSVVTVQQEMTVRRAAELMAQHKLRRLPVVDRDGRLVGIVSRVDLLRTIAPPQPDSRSEDLGPQTDEHLPLHVDENAPIRTAMSPIVPTVAAEAPLSEVVNVVLSNRFKRAVVVDKEGHVLGIITDGALTDVLTPEPHLGALGALLDRFVHRSRTEAAARQRRGQRAQELMLSGADVVIAHEDEPVRTVLAAMVDKGRTIAPVVNEAGTLTGVVSRADILAGLVEG